MKFKEPRLYADPEAAARKLMEIANSVEPVQDGRIISRKSTARSCPNFEAARPNMVQASSLQSNAAGSGSTRAAHT